MKKRSKHTNAGSQRKETHWHQEMQKTNSKVHKMKTHVHSERRSDEECKDASPIAAATFPYQHQAAILPSLLLQLPAQSGCLLSVQVGGVGGAENDSSR